MQEYIIKRALSLIPTTVGVSIIIFIIMRVMPGDVAILILSGGGGESNVNVNQAQLDALRETLGLNQPIYIQYLNWMWGLVRLEGGKSLWSGIPVVEEILQRFPLTLELAILALLVSLVIAVPLGVTMAVKQDTWIDYVLRVFSLIGITMPSFWVGTLIILVLVASFRWLPPLAYAHFVDNPWANLQQMLFPALTLGYGLSAIVSRMTRSMMLEVLRQDYIRTARAKGLRDQAVVIRHALKNAALPVITISGIQIAFLLGGTIVIETLFTLPGMGSYLIDAINRRDYPVVQVVVTFYALLVMSTNLLVDVLYAWLDPRVRFR